MEGHQLLLLRVNFIIALTFCLRSIPRTISRLAVSIASLGLALSCACSGATSVVNSFDAPARVILLVYKLKGKKTADTVMFYDGEDTFAESLEGWRRYNYKAISIDEAGTT